MVKIESSVELVEKHATAVSNCIKAIGKEQEVLSEIQKLGVKKIEEFLSVDVDTMRRWVMHSEQNLKFVQFKDIYLSLFCNGDDKFVDGNYNAYKYLEEIDISVCPYCDDEYLDTVKIYDKKRRTSEIDHFFSKSKYPALAMCFYNLVPSGHNCNRLKLANELGMSPHEPSIEQMTFLFPDIPVGAALESIDPEDCRIQFHAKNGMIQNVKLLALEERYKRHAEEVHRLLMNLQLYNEEKIEELVKQGFGTKENIISSNFGPQGLKEKKKTLRQKMLRDLTGY